MIGNDWDIVLSNILNDDTFKILHTNIINLYDHSEIYPDKKLIFNAFKITSFNDVKVVILGQDPYHGEGEAHGLSFSVNEGVKIPPSLKNIYNELYSDLNIEISTNGNLEKWAKQGVLLMNSVLTVEKDKPASHKNIGWNILTDNVIKSLNEKETPVVFILWGNFAKEKKKLITNPKHLILESVHPSPFSARNGFFGSKPFSKTNNFLEKNNMQGINW